MIEKWIFAGVAGASLTVVAQGEVAGSVLPAGVYEGSYVCPQGPTGLRLTVRTSGRGQQTARFDFGGHGEVPRGAYLVIVQVEGDDIVLTPLRWLNRPRDFDMVGARLRRNGAQLSGTISNPDCSDVALHRLESAQPPAHPEAR